MDQIAEVRQKYIKWVEAEAARLESDGCTLVSELYQWACFEHDLAYRTKKDPRVAFQVGWENAPTISRRDADDRFKSSMQLMSPLGRWSPISYIRWAGVRVGGWFRW